MDVGLLVRGKVYLWFMSRRDQLLNQSAVILKKLKSGRRGIGVLKEGVLSSSDISDSLELVVLMLQEMIRSTYVDIDLKAPVSDVVSVEDRLLLSSGQSFDQDLYLKKSDRGKKFVFVGDDNTVGIHLPLNTDLDSDEGFYVILLNQSPSGSECKIYAPDGNTIDGGSDIDVPFGRCVVPTWGLDDTFSSVVDADTDAVHLSIAGEIAAITNKVTPIGADLLLIEDSADGNNKKSILISNLPFQFNLPFQSNAAANLTLTNQANTLQFLGNSNRNILKADLSRYSKVRIVARVVTLSASVNSPRVIVRYITTFSTTAANFLDIGTSEVNASLSATGVVTSSWIDLSANAKADVFITILQHGGDGVADPALGPIMVQFK